MAQPQVDFVVAERFAVGESPVWDADNGQLLWCDIPEGAIHTLHVASGRRSHWKLREPVGSFGLAQGGRLVVALRDEVVLFDRDSGDRELVARVRHAKPGMRLNDGKVGPDGAFWAGSMDASGDGAPAGVLYRFAPDGDVRVIREGVAISNGLAWNAEGTRLYHSDSRGDYWLDTWDFDPSSGDATNPRRLSEHDDSYGRFDGGACDMAGNYWSAGPSAGQVNRFSTDGKWLDAVKVPLAHPTMPCFGGPDLQTVFVTSLDSGTAGPGRDGIVSFRAEVPGVPVAKFAR
ncbi:sugar lactone lactonase YvrE [Devosia sp. UYZn731]|uniref:SMP-30/gluconolactonase/LRE family protein n=1 Tax=Devosia sp. UYZn731 TaxID=3156345 RepID=UPI00339AE1A4